MSITVKQAWTGVDLSLEQGSGSNSNSTATVTYIVEGTEDDITACTSAYELLPEPCSRDKSTPVHACFTVIDITSPYP